MGILPGITCFGRFRSGFFAFAVSGTCWLTIAIAQPAPAARPRPVQTIYVEFCASCHGRELEGAQGPSLIDDIWLHASDDAGIAASIRAGNPAKEMPPFSPLLSEAEIRNLVVLIREKRAELLSPERLERQSNRALPRELTTAQFTTELHRFRVESIAENLETPWSMAFLPDGRMLVTERPGRLRVIAGGQLQKEPIQGIPTTREFGNGQAGLMAVALHPRFRENGWIYLSFAHFVAEVPDNRSQTKLVRGRIREGAWVDEQVIWSGPLESYRAGLNFGGRVIFDGRGHVFLTIGDRQALDKVQDLRDPAGKIHRVHDDGRIPSDNPFIHEPNALPSIWSVGHRSPQGLALEPRTGVLWETEHGPRGGDELNVIRGGGNYGWPVISHGMGYNGTAVAERTEQEGMEQPIVHWTPSIAVSEIAFYEGATFPKWRRSLLVTSLRLETLLRLELDGQRVVRQEILLKELGRLRDIVVGPDGYVYLAINFTTPVGARGISFHGGRIIRLVPAE